MNSIDIIGNSPALNHNSWTSPSLNTNTLLNYPLFNNALTSFGFAKTQFSPNLNLFQDAQFDRNMFDATSKMESFSREWTPETSNRPLFSATNTRQRMGFMNSIGDTPPDVKIGTANGAFLRRVADPTKVGSGVSVDGLKYSSPSSFLQSSNPPLISRNVLSTVYEKI